MNDTRLGRRRGMVAVHVDVVVAEQVLRWPTSAQEAADGRNDRAAAFAQGSVVSVRIRVEHVLEPRPVAAIEASCIPSEKRYDRGSVDAATRHVSWKALTG